MELAKGNTLNSAKTDPRDINNISFSKKATEFSSDKLVDILSVIGDDGSISNILTPSASPIVYPINSSTESPLEFYCNHKYQASGQTKPIGTVNSNATSLSTSAAHDILALTPSTTPTTLTEYFATGCEWFLSECYYGSNNKSFVSSDTNSTSLSSGVPLDLRTFSAYYRDASISNGSSSILSESPLDLRCSNLNSRYNPISNGLSSHNSSYCNNHYSSIHPSHQDSPSYPPNMYYTTKTQCYRLPPPLTTFGQNQDKKHYNDPYADHPSIKPGIRDTTTQCNSSEQHKNVLLPSESLKSLQNQLQYYDPHIAQSSIKHTPQELIKIDKNCKKSNVADAKNQKQHYSRRFNQLPDKYYQSHDMLNLTDLNDAVSESAGNSNNKKTYLQLSHEISAKFNHKETTPCTLSNIPKKDDRTDRLDMPPSKRKLGVKKKKVKELFLTRRQRDEILASTIIRPI